MSGADASGRLSARSIVCPIAIGLMLLVRCVALSADPPAWLSWSTGIDTDEGFYTLDARHEALFGHWAPGDFHDRLLSPLLSSLQQGVFHVFGPSLLTARALCVLFGLLTVGLLWLALRRTDGVAAADVGAMFLGLSPPFVFYNRLALQETPTVFWLVLAFWCWSLTMDEQKTPQSAYLLVLSGLAFGVGVVFKPLALMALPAFLRLWRKPRLTPPLLALTAVMAAYLFAWYAPHHAALARMALFYRVHQIQPQHWSSLRLNIRRGFVGGERGLVPYLLALATVPVVLARWGMRRRSEISVFFMLWLLTGVLFCLLSSYAPSRYYVLFFPALAGLGALGWVRLGAIARSGCLAVFLLVSGLWLGQAWLHHTDDRSRAAGVLRRTLMPHSVVIGEFAPDLCLDTLFVAAPVQPGLSNDDHPVERLHATAVAVTRTPFWESWWRARYPGLVQPSHLMVTLSLGGPRRYVVDVFSVARQENRRKLPNGSGQANFHQEE